MKNIAFALAALLALVAPAYAQSSPGLAAVVATCGTPPSTYAANTNRPITQNTSGQTCSAGTSTPSGTQNVNITQVGGNAVTTTVPVAGAGTAGTPAGGVLSVQGVSGGTAVPVSESPAARTIVALDVSTVTTGGTAVTALTAGHRTAGGFLQNPRGATIDLCINEQGAATGTTSAGATTCIPPGGSYTLAPTSGAVSVITSDSAHPFAGYGMN